MPTLLETTDLVAHYGDFQALFGVNFRLDAGETVAIIGANGAGKTTLMRSIAGLIDNAPDAVHLDGEPMGDADAADILGRGVAMVPEGRKLFASLSVEENLLIGRHQRKTSGPWTIDALYALFPVLAERRRQPATSLSGGQQQMVAIARALISNPRVLLCDELSLGLAPVVIRDIYAALPRIREGGAAVVVVEQDIARALDVADRAYCLMEGRVTLEGAPSALSREAIHDAYFGTPATSDPAMPGDGVHALSDGAVR